MADTSGLYLGEELDAAGARNGNSIDLDPAHLTTHGVIIGMTNRSIPGLNNTLCLSPALIATKDDIDQITGAIDGALTRGVQF